jgi:ankyrin repeat protein
MYGTGRHPTYTIMAAEAAADTICTATSEGDTETVARMLDEDPRLLTTMWAGDYPLLALAAEDGHPDIVKLLLERGADVNTSTISGFSALHLAADFRHEEVVSLLLSSGADVYRRDVGGWTALMYASHRGLLAVVRLLLRSMGGRGVDGRHIQGFTALYRACSRGHADVVRALLLAGADHATAGNDGMTPQQIAQNWGHPECAALLQVRHRLQPLPNTFPGKTAGALDS